MIALPLTAAERSLFERSLWTGYQMKVTVQLLTLDHGYVADLSSRLVDGQVNVDSDAEVTRSLTLSLVDPDNTMDLDSDSPADGALFADRMIRVVWSVWSELLPKWVDVPVFCGPITSVVRDDALVAIEAQGKERLLLPPSVAWYSHTFSKGWGVAGLVQYVLREWGGESKFELTGFSTVKTTRPFTLTAEASTWPFVKSVVGPLWHRQLFYDGRGVCRLRATPRIPVFTWSEAALTSKPKVSFDTAALRNTVLVVGGTPKGKPQVRAAIGAPKTHPVSSWRLGRKGKQNILLERVQDDTLLTYTAASQRAAAVLESVLLTSVTVEFESVPIPHLEPEDVYTLSTRDFSLNQRVKRFTLPLKAGSTMPVGFTAKRSVNVARVRGR